MGSKPGVRHAGLPVGRGDAMRNFLGFLDDLPPGRGLYITLGTTHKARDCFVERLRRRCGKKIKTISLREGWLIFPEDR